MMDTLRKMMLNRIENIKENENGFHEDKWRFLCVSTQQKHISEADFDSMDDKQLFFWFNEVLRQHYGK